MTYYEVLGVEPGAPTDQIRRAYLGLARRYHPDQHASADADEVASAEARMREINLAWQVLGDETGRAAYDRSLGLRDDVGPVSTGPIIKQPSTAFRPYFPVDEDDDDSWRYEPDEGDPSTVPPRALLVAPPALLALGVLLLAVSLPLGSRPLMVVGALCLGAAALLFVGTPVVAMFLSQGAEERASRRR